MRTEPRERQTLQQKASRFLKKIAEVQDEVIDLRVKKILKEDRPYLPRISAESLAPAREARSDSAVEIGRYFCDRRRQLVKMLRDIPQSHWIRTGLHELDGHVTLEELIRRMGKKDMNQIDELAQIVGVPRERKAEASGN